MRISDWSSDVCSSDLTERRKPADQEPEAAADLRRLGTRLLHRLPQFATELSRALLGARELGFRREESGVKSSPARSEEHTSELQSLMRISYAVFCLKKKIETPNITTSRHSVYRPNLQ